MENIHKVMAEIKEFQKEAELYKKKFDEDKTAKEKAEKEAEEKAAKSKVAGRTKKNG